MPTPPAERTPAGPASATRARRPTRRPTSAKAVESAGVAYADWDLPTAAARVEEGLPAGILADVQRRLDLTQKGLAHVLGVSESTLGRRKEGARLSPGVSERALRIARLTEVAARVLGGLDEARAWMKEPNHALGDQPPLEMARTEPGARLVERLLAEVAYGLPL